MTLFWRFCGQTDTFIDKLVEIFLKLSVKTVQVHLIIWTTLVLCFHCDHIPTVGMSRDVC